MSRIKEIITSLTAFSKDIKKADQKPLFKYINVYNHQLERLLAGDANGYAFATPALFIEIIPGDQKQLGAGFTSYPKFLIVLHLIHQKLHDGQYMDRNLDIFDIAALYEAKMSTNCVPYVSRVTIDYSNLDYDHNNMYEYVMAYTGNFINNAGSIYNPDVDGGYWASLDGVNLDVNVFKTWYSGVKYYSSKNVVVFKNKAYICIVDNEDELFDVAKWTELIGWQPNLEFKIDDYCYHENNVYKCIVANNDSSFTEINWTLIYVA